MSPKGARWGGAAFDTLAGGLGTTLAVKSIIGTSLSMAAAATAITTAPVTAAASLALGVVFLALNTMFGGMCVGLLKGACDKIGIPTPAAVFRSTKSSAARGIQSVKSTFKSKKASPEFKKAANANPPSVAPAGRPQL